MLSTVYRMAPVSETEFILGLMRLLFEFDDDRALTSHRIFGSGLDLHGGRMVR